MSQHFTLITWNVWKGKTQGVVVQSGVLMHSWNWNCLALTIIVGMNAG